MGEKKMEIITEVDRRIFIYPSPTQGFSLRFVSGPDIWGGPSPGDWLDRWEIIDGQRPFGFGPKPAVFAAKSAAEHSQKELHNMVGIITEVVPITA